MTTIICNIEESKKQVEEILKKWGEEKKPIQIVSGAYGDMEHCEAIIESVITPPEGGTFVKFLGCSYLFKGYPEKSMVEYGLGIGKAMISILPREILGKDIFLKLYF